jgi:hypothetical protein
MDSFKRRIAMRKIAVSGNRSVEVSGDAAITVADGSSPTIITRLRQDSKMTLRIGKRCRVSALILQEKEASLEQETHVGEGSSVQTNGVWLSPGGGRVEERLEGRGARAESVHVFLGEKNATIHLDCMLVHECRDTKGNVLVKGVVKDEASAGLDGMIKIGKGGRGAESFLGEHVMLLNPGAHATAKPGLEIGNDDVSSRHAASVSQIDEEKIFYLMSRGLGREDARRLIVEGFLGSAIGRMEALEGKEELVSRIGKML